jgi:type VI secretion system secreted protein VgrG
MPGRDDPNNTGPAAFGNTTEYIESRPTRAPAPEAEFAFSAASLPDAHLRVVSARVREAMGELYEAVVEVCTADPALDSDAMLGARCLLEIGRGPRHRRVCGVARRVERMDSWGSHRRARVFLVPALWALSQRFDSRIFQGKTAVEIIRAVVDEAGLDAAHVDASGLTREYASREYCVQYRETDLAFVMRLLEEEGIASWFKHDGGNEVMVLSDSLPTALCPTLDRRPVPYSPAQSALAPVEVVQRLEFAEELRSTGFTGRDYDFTRPQAELDLTRAQPRGDQGPRARYEYPVRSTLGDYDDGSYVYTSHDGARRAEVRHQEERAAEARGEGAGNVTGFMPGRVFELVGHEHGDLDRRYVITRVTHHAHAPEELVTQGEPAKPAAGLDRYRNEFEGAPAETLQTPSRKTRRPMILAAQTATVTGPLGEEIYVDHHARIKVQFHWDRKGKRDAQSSCWVRVAQVWAGAGWGFQFIPRVGMEVVVTFLEGDPDRPLVTGCVYNGVNGTPYALPEEKTRSTIKSNSSPGGGGYNELRFEDLKGSEEVYFHAQLDHNEVIERNHTETVKGNQSISVGGDQSMSIGHDQTITVGNDETITVGNNQTINVGANEVITVAVNQTINVGANEEINIGVDQTVTAGGNIAITAVGGDCDVAAGGDITVTARGGDCDIAASGDVTVKANGGDCDVAASGDVTVSAKGGDCDIAASGDVTVKANGGDCDISASGDVTVTAAADCDVTAARVTILGSGEVHIASGGASITLTPGMISMSAPVIQLNGGGATLVLAGTATLKGSTVNLNC